MSAPDRTPDRKQLIVAIARHHSDLLHRARQLVGREAADDLVQNTVEKALRHLDAFTPDTNMLAWLRRIMANLMIDEWRRQKRRQQTVALDADNVPAAPLAEQQPPVDPPWRTLTRDDVLRAMPFLTRHVRPVFALHLQGLSYRQIAMRLGLRPPTVGTRLLRARLQMRRLLTVTLLDRENDPANDVQQLGIALDVPPAVPPTRRRRKQRWSPSPTTDAPAEGPALAGLAG